jgi:hypothetical protein
MVGQRDPVARPAQVMPDLLRAGHSRCAGDDPPPGPDRLGHQQVGPFLLHQRPNQTTKALREGMDRYPGGRAGRPPRGAISGDPTGRDQAVHVRMVGQGTGPGVQHTPHPDQPADVVWVRGQRDERWRRSTDQEVGAILLMTADHLPSLVGHGEDDVNVRDRQACLTSCCPPGFGVLVVACGATAVAAGVVGIRLLPAVVTRPQVPPSGLGATVDDSSHGAAVAGQKVLAESRPLVRTIAPAAVCHLWHARAPTRVAIGPEGVAGGLHDIEGVGRERRVARGGTGALMTEALLDNAP